LVTFHIDAAAAKGYALGFEAKTLLNGGIATQLDFSAGAEHALPRHSERAMEGPRNSPGRAGISCGASHFSIGRNFSAWDFANCSQDSGLHGDGHGTILSGCSARARFVACPEQLSQAKLSNGPVPTSADERRRPT